MQRSRVLDFRASRAPQSLGQCIGNIPVLCSLINEAGERLIKSAMEHGWHYTFARYAFNTNRDDPYVTLPRHIARIINADYCRYPVLINNEFYEFMEFGQGLKPNRCDCNLSEMFDRGWFPTFKDLDNKTNPKTIRVMPTDQRDVDKRVFIQGVDVNGTVLRSLDNGIDVQGVYLRMQSPFTDSSFEMGANKASKITGIQKDPTVGDVRFYEVDTVTAESTALLIMEPSEQSAAYRRYLLNGLPNGCCPDSTSVQINAMVKLDFVPVAVDTDYLPIPNIPALKAACESVRYGEMDTPQAQQLSKVKWADAIRMLNQELGHYQGTSRPAVVFSPCGYDQMPMVI